MVVLTDAQLDFMARAASWKFNVDFRVTSGDPVVFTGDGVDDLDALISRIQSTAPLPVRMQLDVGKLFSQYVAVTVDDVVALRQRYIDIYGTVSKPQTPFQQTTGEAVEIQIT